MHILCLGLNYQTADVHLRERMAFSDESAKAAMSRLGCGSGAQPGTIAELVILSTCNRVELYAVSNDPQFGALESFLSEVHQIELEAFRPSLYRLIDLDAVEHLFRVASGLDSLVIGEPQILGQVMHAFELARAQSSAGPLLSRLFQNALHAGKRARTETTISHNPASISSMAVRLAQGVVHHFASTKVVVVGAGEMAALAVEALRKRGVKDILVVNRTLERARRLAELWGAGTGTFEQLLEAIAGSDILISSTGAPHVIIQKQMVAPVMRLRAGRPLVILDIAVPRDVDPEVGELPGVQLFDIDALHEHLETSLDQRRRQAPLVEAIIQEETRSFEDYLTSLDVVPIIKAMRKQAEAIRIAELEKTLRRLPELSSGERERLELMTRAMVKKILHAPITRLRSEAGSIHSARYTEVARELFNLEGGNGNHAKNIRINSLSS